LHHVFLSEQIKMMMMMMMMKSGTFWLKLVTLTFKALQTRPPHLIDLLQHHQPTQWSLYAYVLIYSAT